MGRVMKLRVLVKGVNFLMEFEGIQRKLGFLTYRFVEAATPEEADGKVADLVRQDLRAKGIVLNDPADPPTFECVEMEEVEELEPPPGFIWFDPSEERA
jgi:hypothetical protein